MSGAYVFTAQGFEPDDLHVIRIEGEEAISNLYRYRVLLASENNEISPDDLVGRNGLITIHRDAEQSVRDRFIHGLISRFDLVMGASRMTYYEVEMVPWAYKLLFRHNCRIFQGLNAAQIVDRVLADAGVPSDQIGWNINTAPPTRDYCTQYRESDWAFISRLLEEEGIYYSFVHLEDKEQAHFADTREGHPGLTGGEEVLFAAPSQMVTEPHVYEFRTSTGLRGGKVELWEYDYTRPPEPHRGSHEDAANTDLAMYDYPAAYLWPGHVSSSDLDRLSRIRMEEHLVPQTYGLGRTSRRDFTAGEKFSLEGHWHSPANQDYVITRMNVLAVQPQGAGEEFFAGQQDPGPDWEVEFEVIPYAVPYRPARVTPKPVIAGCQTGIVVGPSGEEIHTNGSGEVCVHMHWDREGAFDGNDSVFLRISQPGAGGRYGWYNLPRVGEEVIVGFLEGNPDRPMVYGCVCNEDHHPPYSLPDNRTRSGIKTCSSPGGGPGNELRFEDRAGEEQIFIHAQHDLHERVQNEKVSYVGMNEYRMVDGDVAEELNSNVSTKILSNQVVDVSQNRNVVVGSTLTEEALQDIIMDAGMNLTAKGGMEAVIEAGLKLTLKAGSGFITIDPMGVSISGPMVMINSGGAAGAATPAGPADPAPPMVEADEQDVDGTNVEYSR